MGKLLPDKQKRDRFLLATGCLLIVAGLMLLGYNQWARYQVESVQEDLRDDYSRQWPNAGKLSWEEVENVVFQEWQPTRVVIPKIGVDLVVLSGDVFDMDLLDQAPVHYQMSDLPGIEAGNVAIAGHRGGKWVFFLDLDFLEPGDKIYLESGGYTFVYVVEWIRIVEPDDWSVIESTDNPVLTLTTCEPKNRNATHRLIVRASLDKVYNYVY